MLLLRSHETFLPSITSTTQFPSWFILEIQILILSFAVLYGLEDQTHYQVSEVNPMPTYLEPEYNKPAKHENKNHEH